jgi:hydrogenase maturation protease
MELGDGESGRRENRPSRPSHPPVRVLCCGSLLAGDDAVGLVAAPALRERLGPQADVIEAGTPGLGLLDMMEGADRCVIVDCMVGGGRPGQVRRLTPAELPSSGVEFTSAHGLGIQEALALGAAVEPERMPREIVIVAVEAASAQPFTEGLSADVRAALPELVEAVVNAVVPYKQQQ